MLHLHQTLKMIPCLGQTLKIALHFGEEGIEPKTKY